MSSFLALSAEALTADPVAAGNSRKRRQSSLLVDEGSPNGGGRGVAVRALTSGFPLLDAPMQATSVSSIASRVAVGRSRLGACLGLLACLDRQGEVARLRA